MTHPNYIAQDFHGQTVYRCCTCEYDTFECKNILYHVANNHNPIMLPETDLTADEWQEQMSNLQPLKGLKIGISLLTWNTKEASIYAARSIVRELPKLVIAGATPFVYWADNDSTDGTRKVLHATLPVGGDRVFMFRDNIGQSCARNFMIEAAQVDGCDYLLMLDGDIELIPDSSVALALAFHYNMPSNAACLGMYSVNCTHEHDDYVARECRSIPAALFRNNAAMAWTQYGMFRMSMLPNFDESGPFGGPGWGLEDDDLYIQIREAGHDSYYTPYFRYMHRRRGSSLKLLDKAQAVKTFEDRKKYLADKWKSSAFGSTHMARLVNQHLTLD